MSHPLQTRIDSLRNRVVRLLAVRGLCMIVATVLATVIALGWIDYCLRFRDRGVLVLFALAVLGVFTWTGYQAVRRLLKARLGDTDVALHVEACFPEVKERLASAVEFLGQPEDDATAGSAAMRRAAIAQATAASEDLDFGMALDRRPALRSALAALVVGGLAACLLVANASAARTVLARLAFPLGTVDWPQQTHLGLRQTIKPIVRGQALEVEVIDTRDAPLPADCRIHYRLTDAQGRSRVETEPMQLLGKAMVARREDMRSPLEFCCTGGDDQTMNWNRVEVVDPPEPPAIRSLTLTIDPPGYTDWPQEVRDAMSPRPILAGSRVQLSGTASKSLKPASTLRFDDGSSLPLEIEADGLTFHVGRPRQGESADAHELILNKSTGYTFHLIDVNGVEGGSGESWQFRVLTDAAPSAFIDQPSGDLFVTDKAVVNFRVRARDDMALREVALIFRWPNAKSAPDSKQAEEKTVSLFRGPDKPPPASRSAFDAGEKGEQETFELPAQPLSDFQLAPGMQLTCYAEATDYLLQTGRSDPRVLTVVTLDQFLERMAARQSQLLAELARVLQLQRDARNQVRALEVRLQESAILEQGEIDRLQSAESNQREVVRSLTSTTDGLPMQVLGLLADLEANRIDNPDFQRHLERLLAEFDRLRREHLTSIGTELTAAVKGSLDRLQASPRPVERDAESETHLAVAGEHQQQVIASLEALLAGMRQWDDYRRFHREVAQLLRNQEEAARSTAALGAETVGRDLKELTPQESGDLKILAESQLELGRRESRLEQEMEQTAAALGQNELLAAETLTDAVAEARRLAIAADMSGVGGKIHDNNLGMAPGDQQRILQNLQEVLDILANNRRQELERLAKKLGEADKDLDALRNRQEELRRKIDEGQGSPASNDHPDEAPKAELKKLAREQEELRQQALQLGRRLERLTADEAASSLGKAAEGMDQGRHAGEAGDSQGSSRGAETAKNALDDASTKLRERLFQIEVQRAIRQQAQLQDAVQHLHRQEERIAAETREFAEKAGSGGLDREASDGLMRLAREQELLRDETVRVSQPLGPADIFREALSAAVDSMGRAFALLQRRETGSTTQEAERNAVERLKLILTALEAEDAGATANGNAAGNQGGNKSDGGRRGVLPLAQLKLLKLLQEDLNLRTQQLNQAEAAGKPAEELREPYARLLDEQRHLAELTARLLRPQPSESGAPSGDLPGTNEPKEKRP